jgi:hypothetical protein
LRLLEKITGKVDKRMKKNNLITQAFDVIERLEEKKLILDQTIYFT